jgi:hypothetical protein
VKIRVYSWLKNILLAKSLNALARYVIHNSMKNQLILILAFAPLFSSFSARSQHLANTSILTETPDQYFLQVKQFGEFIDRFNYVTDWKGNRIDSKFEANYPRFQYLNFLLNQEDVRLQNPVDSSYINLCNQFLCEVTHTDSSQFISLYSGMVLAKSLVNFNYQGKYQQATISFLPEVLPDRSAKWVITNVETKCFNTLQDSLKIHFIAPNSHETSFINLKRIENLSNPIYFYPASVTSDASLLFMTEIAANRLTITNIEKVIYLITFPNWLITVEEFNRNTSNSGWLISNVTQK